MDHPMAAETVVQRCSVKKVFLEISQNSLIKFHLRWLLLRLVWNWLLYANCYLVVENGEKKNKGTA